jgi:RNA polymerase sigma factor (sigma-70 family)
MPATLAPRKTPARRSSVSFKAETKTPELARVLSAPVEYVPSPEFEQPELAEAILQACPPGKLRTAPKAPANTPPYLAELYNIPLLDPTQEFHLFRQMNFWKHRAELLRQQILADGLTAARRRRFEEHLAQAQQLRNAIVQANLRLVVSIAKTMVDDANRLDDLISDGNVPLVRAVEIFDFTRGLRFSTYATWAVRNCLFRSSPRNRKLMQRFKTSADTEFVTLAQRESDHNPLLELPTPGILSELLAVLPDRDRVVVEARFGLGNRSASSKFREIAGELNISTERARQLLARALDRLRELISERSPELAMAAS